jgi:uncharacterized lipoprotein YajG
MSIQRVFTAVLLSALAVLAGCATSRSELQLSTPPAASVSPPAPDAPIAVIRSVKDERQFEKAPSDPSIPSLGFEGADAAPAHIKLRAIGRKRNTYGMALGDVLLQDGQTVELVVRETLASALREKGYNVQAAAGTTPAKLTLDVQIKKFWAWIQPGFWAITVKTNVALEMNSPPAAPITVAIDGEDPRQVVTDSAWIEAVEKTLKSLRAELIQKLPPAR